MIRPLPISTTAIARDIQRNNGNNIFRMFFEGFRLFDIEITKLSSRFGNIIIISNWEAVDDVKEDNMWISEICL
ncbi:MAG: hypothetical protein ACTSXD_10265 [Candidatus Heimdallarchaeaceae archaeon]